MTLADLGYHEALQTYHSENGYDGFSVGRIIAEHKERYVVKNEQGEYEAEVVGNLRFTAQSRADFPAVGDWVVIAEYDHDKAIIHHVLPRKTLIERQAISSKGEKQIIASNIDTALIVQSIDRDYSINRIERYLTICHNAGVDPVIILTKIDLIDREALAEIKADVQARIKDIPILAISNAWQDGLAPLKEMIQAGKTYCLLGSSGVGKSTLLNTLMGKKMMETGEISSFSNRGKHVTTHRELLVLQSGGIIIDNPGMREVGIADASGGLASTFESIAALASGCKFNDCTHTSEVGCAVLEAVNAGIIDEAAYQNYLRMTREKDHYEASVAEKRQKDKEFGKMIRYMKKVKANKR